MTRGRVDMKRMALRKSLLCAWLLILAPAAAEAQTDAGKVAAARQIGFDGIKDYQAGNYAEASDKLERAYALVKAPTIGLWSARALAKLDRWVAATERYLETTRLPLPETNRDNHRKAQEDAAKERATLLARIPSLRVDVSGVPANEVELTMDGVVIDSALVGVARPVDPGKHRVVASWRGQQESGEIELREGTKETMTLTFSADAAAPAPEATAKPDVAGGGTPETQPAAPISQEADYDASSNTLAYVALGVGGVGLVVGGITGVMAMGKKSELEDSGFCSDVAREPDVHDDVDSLNTLRTLSTVGFVVGVVGAGVGVTLLITGGGKAERGPAARTELRLGPGRVGLAGWF
jgi:hypothetical protein